MGECGCSIVIGDRVCCFVACWIVRFLVFAWVVFSIIVSCVARVGGVARVSCVTRVSGVRGSGIGSWCGGIGSRCDVSSRSGVSSWGTVSSWSGVFVSVAGRVIRVWWVRVCWGWCRVSQDRCKKEKNRLHFVLSNLICRKSIKSMSKQYIFLSWCSYNLLIHIIIYNTYELGQQRRKRVSSLWLHLRRVCFLRRTQRTRPRRWISVSKNNKSKYYIWLSNLFQ